METKIDTIERLEFVVCPLGAMSGLQDNTGLSAVQFEPST